MLKKRNKDANQRNNDHTFLRWILMNFRKTIYTVEPSLFVGIDVPGFHGLLVATN